LALSSAWMTGCKEDGQNSLNASPPKVNFVKEGGNAIVNIQTDAESWNIKNPASGWLTLSSTSGTQKTAAITMSVTTKSIKLRIDTLTITAGNAKPVQVMVTQPAFADHYSLSVDHDSLAFYLSGGTTSITITTDAPKWNISNFSDWVQISKTSGTSGSTVVEVTTPKNSTGAKRSTSIMLSAESTPGIQISIAQKAEIFPGYNTSAIAPDAAGMSSTAMEIAKKIKVGFNIGNTLEAIGGETAWGNPQITNDLIKFVKQSGFNAIRLPCSFNQYSDVGTAKISSSWLNRVKQVVQYCVTNDVYVILNIHWDGGWLENNCTEAKKADNNARQKAFWEQIATTLRDFDEHLLFASANEPNVSDAVQMGVLLSYHQTFIDAVRSTGGKNAYRVLVVQGPNTDIETTKKLMTQLPTDIIPNRMMAEIHYYTPWNFAGMTKDESWGSMAYYWGKDYHSTTDPAHNSTWGEEAEVDRLFVLMKNQFVDKGIPVVLGEFGAIRRDNLTGDALKLHLASRAFYLKYVTKQANANGLLPFFWDTGGLFDRSKNTVSDQQSLDALMQGANE